METLKLKDHSNLLAPPVAYLPVLMVSGLRTTNYRHALLLCQQRPIGLLHQPLIVSPLEHQHLIHLQARTRASFLRLLTRGVLYLQLLLPGLVVTLALATLILLYMAGRELRSFLEQGWSEKRLSVSHYYRSNFTGLPYL